MLLGVGEDVVLRKNAGQRVWCHRVSWKWLTNKDKCEPNSRTDRPVLENIYLLSKCVNRTEYHNMSVAVISGKVKGSVFGGLLASTFFLRRGGEIRYRCLRPREDFGSESQRLKTPRCSPHRLVQLDWKNSRSPTSGVYWGRHQWLSRLLLGLNTLRELHQWTRRCTSRRESHSPSSDKLPKSNAWGTSWGTLLALNWIQVLRVNSELVPRLELSKWNDSGLKM